MVLHNPNNWHWVNKDVSEWTREYLTTELVGLKAEKDGSSAEISKILSMDGDVDVSQRKNKVITIFDVKLQLEYTGKVQKQGEAAGETADVSGTITIPEVAHDTEQDEYVFEVELYGEDSSKQPVKDIVRSQITPLLRQKLAQIAPTLIEKHGKDLQHAPGSRRSRAVGARLDQFDTDHQSFSADIAHQLALLGVPAQAVLGGITVLTDLNPWTVALHLMVSMAMISVAVVLVQRVREPDGPAELGVLRDGARDRDQADGTGAPQGHRGDLVGCRRPACGRGFDHRSRAVSAKSGGAAGARGLAGRVDVAPLERLSVSRTSGRGRRACRGRSDRPRR